MNGRRNAKTRDASVYPSFLQILIPPPIFLTLFFYPVRESYILLNYPFSSISRTAGSHRGLWTIMTNLASAIKLLILVKDLNPRTILI